jgi:hypothetical protein
MGRPLVAAAYGPQGTGITDAISAGSDGGRVGRDSGQRIGDISVELNGFARAAPGGAAAIS